MAMMLAVVPPQIVMGALLFFVAHPLYEVYALCGLIFPGLSQLEDQQLGGLLLWVHGAMMSVAGILLVARCEWMRRLPEPVKTIV
jgi:putative membrane protein